MRALLLICLFASIIKVHGASRSTDQRIEGFGYGSETHNLVTTDGYILTLFRITDLRRNSTAPRPPVIMMHGLWSSADGWIINGPSHALAFNLVESGYDVWLGNVRGTPYSKKHLSISNTSKRFWRFSIHEVGIYDLPAIIDYVLQVTQQSTLHYVGYSQGCMIFLILLSTHPEYNDKIRSTNLLAPVAFMKYANSKLLHGLSLFLGSYTPLSPLVGDRPLLQSHLIRNLLNINRCPVDTSNSQICSLVLYIIAGGVSGYLNSSLLPDIFQTHPASCSANQYIHLMQLHVSGRFEPYNYALEGNLKRYKAASPPSYRLSNIKTRLPLHLYYSNFDQLSSKRDVEHLTSILGKRAVQHFIDLPQFAHVDFLWAYNVRDVINRPVLDVINKAEASVQWNS